MLAALMLVAAAPTRADAQIGWIKGLFGKKSKPPAEQAAPPAAPAGSAAPAAAAPAAPAATQGGVPYPAAAQTAPPAAYGAVGGAAAAAAPVAETDPKQMEYGRMLDAEPPTLESTRRRVEHWQMMKLTPPFNPEVAQRYDAALRAYEEAKSKDSTSKATTMTMEQANKKLDQAVYALRANSFSDAESIADDILSTDPNNERAKALKAAAVKGQQASKLKYTLVALGAAAVALFALFAAFSGKIFKKKDGEEKPADRGSSSASAGGPKVYLKVVDGVGRGRLVAIANDVFRIGSTSGTSDDDKNDLVISDDQKSVSRFHCSVVKKGRDYFLIDSSLNGTRLNDKPLARGESQRLRDGDEFTVADVSLIKFVKT
jgi:hypothetical protein